MTRKAMKMKIENPKLTASHHSPVKKCKKYKEYKWSANNQAENAIQKARDIIKQKRLSDLNEILDSNENKNRHKWGSHYLTDEQEVALSMSKENGWLKVEAMAGSGKTTMLNVISTLGLSNKKCLYIAFNKAIVSEAESAFPRNVTCKTTHSLAGAAMVAWRDKKFGDGKFDPKRIGGINGKFISYEYDIKESYSSDALDSIDCSFNAVEISYLALAAIDKFCMSSDTEIKPCHAYNDKVQSILTRIKFEQKKSSKKKLEESLVELRSIAVKIANRIWENMINTDSSARITHNVYLKAWALSNPDLSKFDVILFDEAQDANPLILDVVLKQKTKNIFVGDRYQQIYSWNGAVNAMSKIETDNTAIISQSFRFGSKIANLASEILRYAYDNNKITVTGFDKIDSKICNLDEYDAFISRTNGCLIREVFREISSGRDRKIAIEGGISTLVDFLADIRKLINREKPKNPELSCFKSWKELVDHSKTDAGGSLAHTVKLIENNDVDSIIGTLSGCNSTNNTKDADIVFTTAHKSKGKEYKRVKLASDFVQIKPLENTEEANLLYVAVTRATHFLDISECDSIKMIDHLK